MIRRIEKPEGVYIERIPGQERLAYALSDQEDLYDMASWAERGGYRGSVIRFYDLEAGEVFLPFEQKRNVGYGRPCFSEGSYYFLQYDLNADRITLFRYQPGSAPEPVTALRASETELYNLQILGSGVHIISQKETFACWYPERFSFPLLPQETACLIEDGKVYVERWIEEGWDAEKDCASDNYRFYHKVITKDFSGETLSEEIGYLHQADDGTWWIV